MLKYLLLLLSVIFLFSACKQDNVGSKVDSPAWDSISTPFNIYRKEACSFAIGTKVYFGLGFGSTYVNGGNATQLNDFWEYDVTTKAWKKLADFPPGKRAGSTAFSMNGKGYIAFGYASFCPPVSGLCDVEVYNDIWEYSPPSNSWKQVATIDDLYSPRYPMSLVIKDKAYIIFGGKTFEFNPSTHSIVDKKFIGYNIVYGGGTASINNKGYVFLPAQGDFDNNFVFEYDPKEDTWSQKKDFPGEPRTQVTAFSLNGFGYCGGGRQPGDPEKFYKDFWKYDATADQWTRIDDYPGKGSQWLCSSVVDNKVIIGSGEGYENNRYILSKDFWLFQPK